MQADPLGTVPEGMMNRFRPRGQYRDGVNTYQYVNFDPIYFFDVYGLVSYKEDPEAYIYNEMYNTFSSFLNNLFGCNKKTINKIEKGPWTEDYWQEVNWEFGGMFGKTTTAKIDYHVKHPYNIQFKVVGNRIVADNPYGAKNSSGTLFTYSNWLWTLPTKKHFEQFWEYDPDIAIYYDGEKKVPKYWRPGGIVPCRKIYRCKVKCCGIDKPTEWGGYALGQIEFDSLSGYTCNVPEESEKPKNVCKDYCNKCR